MCANGSPFAWPSGLRLGQSNNKNPRHRDNGTGAKNLMTTTASEDHHDQ